MLNSNALEGTKAIKESEANFASAPTSKKIGFFSAMLIVVGSSVGAGIFFKAGAVLGNSQGSIIFAIFCWLFAGFAVISMALALIEIASGRNDNLSMIGWCQTFNKRFTYKACKNFMVYIYLPLTYFFMPLYSIMSFQDGISSLIPNYSGLNTKADWAVMMVFALLISSYFIFVNGKSSKMGNIHNWIITSVKFIPLVMAILLGIIVVIMNGGVQNPDYTAGFNTAWSAIAQDPASIFTFSNLTPGFGMFVAIGAIFFAFDGFYVTAGIQTEMKEPKKTPLAILIGMISVTVIYLVIAIAMSIGSEDGTPFGFQNFLESRGAGWVYAAFQIMIGIGVLGIINGYALWSTRFVEDLIKANEIPYSTKLVNKITPKAANVGIFYNLVLSIPVILVFCIIGGLAYTDSSNYGTTYGTGVAQMYSFADLMANWTSVLAFTFIIFAIFGGLKNRKTNQVYVEKSKYFKLMAYLAIATMSLPIFITFLDPIANLFMLYWIPDNTPGYVTDVLVPRIMLIVALFFFAILIFVPTICEDYLLIRRYGSIEKGEIKKIELMANAKGIDLKTELINQIRAQKRIALNEEEKNILNINSMNDLPQYA
ncbi:MAG: APC family permease [Malacoplasma sp.]|nr:APC family permease [Malacoplasma sp.]